MQDGKIGIPQTLSQQSPLKNILENIRLSSFDLIFSTIINFFHFHLRTLKDVWGEAKNVLDTLASWMETLTNTRTFLVLKNFKILPFYLNVVTISKDFNLIFLHFFSKLPSKSALSRPSILPFFNGENLFLVHGFH